MLTVKQGTIARTIEPIKKRLKFIGAAILAGIRELVSGVGKAHCSHDARTHIATATAKQIKLWLPSAQRGVYLKYTTNTQPLGGQTKVFGDRTHITMVDGYRLLAMV